MLRIRRETVLMVVLTTITSGSLLGLSLRADERFHPYEYGSGYVQEPLEVLLFPIRFTFATWRQFGNFRPLGRIVEHVNYLVDEALATTAGIPMHVALGLVRIASAVLLAVVVLRLVDRLVDDVSWTRIAVIGAYPALLVAFGGGSSMVVFSGYYFQTAAVVVVAATAVAAPVLWRDSELPAWRLAAAAVVGAALALTNELAWVAVPVAATVVLAVALRDRVPVRQLSKLPVARVAGAGLAGFVATAVPMRIVIGRACATVQGGCYAASEPQLGEVTPSLLAGRLAAGLPVGTYDAYRVVARDDRTWLLAAGVAVVAYLLLRDRGASMAGTGASMAETTDGASDRATVSGSDDDAESRTDPWRWRNGAVVALVGLALIVAGALLSSLSPVVQSFRISATPWREAPVAVTGWALLLGGSAGAVLDRWASDGRRWRAALAVVALLTGIGVGTAVTANTSWHDRESRDLRLLVADRIAVAMASFHEGSSLDAAIATRCAMVQEFAELHPGRPGQTAQLQNAVNRAATRRYGRPFCPEDFVPEVSEGTP